MRYICALLVLCLAAPAAALTPIWTADEIPWQNLDALTRRKVVYSPRATFVVLEAKRGKGHDMNHWHHHDQITHVLEGDVEVIVGGQKRRVGAGGTYACDSLVPHSLVVLSERAKLVEVFAPAREDFRGAPWVGSAPRERAPFGPNELRGFVYDWFALFDRNAPVGEFLPFLVDRGLDMRFPEAKLASVADFRRWYAGILATIRSASHDVLSIELIPAGPHAVIHLVVRWRATTVAGQPLDFTVRQRWVVDRGPGGRPVIRSYVVTPR